MFVDAVGGDNSSYKSREFEAHEAFVELSDYLDAKYKQVADMDGSCIYMQIERP